MVAFVSRDEQAEGWWNEAANRLSMRRRFVLSLTAAAIGGLAVRSPALGADKLRVGTVNAISDAPLFIAQSRGFFKEQNLDVELVAFDSAARMVAPLGTGQLDAGAGGPSAGLYNAVASGIGVKIVADKGRMMPGFTYSPLLFRKDLIESGKVKSPRDFKGLTIAITAAGSSAEGQLYEWLKKGGLQWTDIKIVQLGFPEMLVAFQNAAIDGAVLSEPVASEAIRAGLAVKMAGTDSIYPNQQAATLFYGSEFIKKRPDVAQRFMIAYIKALRYYSGAIKNGRFTGPNAESVIAILTQYTPLKDRATYAVIATPLVDPDGYLNMASLTHDLNVYKDLGEVKSPITIDQVVDLSFVDAALRVIGKYKR